MELLSKVGRYEFLSEPFHCDFSSHLFMGHLGNHLLNAADFHSNDRGYGMNYLMPRHKTWVLSRLAIEMTEMPKSYDKFYVETWVENAMKYFTARDFKICGKPAADEEEEKVYGYGKSVWAMIDTETRQPVDIFSFPPGVRADIDGGNVVSFQLSGDNIKLLFHRRDHFIFKFLRQKRKRVQGPFFKRRVVGLRIAHGDQMPDAPGYNILI